MVCATSLFVSHSREKVTFIFLSFSIRKNNQIIFVDIKPNEGPRCPPIIFGKPDQTMLQYWTRIYVEQRDAPTDGWCPNGQYKWIVYGSVIGKKRDTCVNNYYRMKK